MHSVEQAVAELRAQARLLVGVEDCALENALGRVLAENLTAPIDVPPADNSAMDGYAVRQAEWPGASEPLPVSQRIPAGVSPAALEAGTAARIFTGAEIPEGADTVVMQEDCTESGEGVLISGLPPRGAHIRRRAQDVAAGQTVLHSGARLRAQDVGVAASLGIASLRVYRPLKVAILSNGSELVEPGRETGPGQIYNSNRYILGGLAKAWGFEVLDLGIAPDDPGVIRKLFERAAGEADVIVSSGGVSVGEEDHVRDVVAELGAIGLWKVSIKPGKPFAFGHVHGTPFLGLPGNPSSVMVTCLVVARPYLFDCQGIARHEVTPLKMPALFDRAPAGRTEYLRVKYTLEGLECHPQQSSGALLSTVWGDGLAIQPEASAINRGDHLDYLPYSILL